MYGSSEILLKLWQCLCIAPVTRKPDRGDSGGGGEKYAFSTLWFVLNTIAMCVFLVCALSAISDDLYVTKTRRSLRMLNTSTAIVTVIHVLLMSILCAMEITFSASRHRTLLEIERQLKYADTVLGTPTTQPVAQYALFAIGVQVVLYAVDGYLWYMVNPFSWKYFICFVYHLINLASMLMFAQMAWSIGIRFHKINVEMEEKLVGFQKNMTYTRCAGCRNGDHKRKFTTTRNIVFVSTISTANNRSARTSNISIPKLQELYWGLCNDIRMINDKFGWQLFLQLFSYCVKLVETPSFIISILSFPITYSSINMKFIIVQVFWVLNYLFQLLLVILPSSYATQKSERTAVIICKYLSEDIEPDDMKQLEMFILQLHKYSIHFSACGIIKLHRSAITTIIGTSITYLVILIQFQKYD